MKLFFVCSAAITDSGLQCASWIKGIVNSISREFEVAVGSTVLSGSEIYHCMVGDTAIDVLPFSPDMPPIELEKTLQSADADVVLLFGTESPVTLKTLEICQKIRWLDRTAVFAQGLCCVCAQHYAEGVPERIIRRYTFRDLMRRQNILGEQRSLFKRAESERQALQLTHHFIGRTTMDKAILRDNNPTANYYKCNDILRNSFYDGQWSYERCEKHRIFVSQYYYPLKGFHYLLEAVARLKSKYPDMTVAVAGYNPINKSLTKKELKDSSYIRYLKSLVKKYDLSSHIELLGELSEEQMKSEYLKANAFVMPSTIENSPNSLAEAMILGVPTIASDVGGVTDFARHNVEAFIYPSSATYLLAHYIDKAFSEKERVSVIAESGRKRAQEEYDREINIKQIESIMRKLSGNIE